MSRTPTAYIIDAVRAPVGKRMGGLGSTHPLDLGAHVLEALITRTGIDPCAVDDVVLGCLDQVGPQSSNIARNSWLAAGFPEHVTGVTIDRQCGSSQQAVHFAAQGVMSGTQDLVVAGGVQNMSMVPLTVSTTIGQHIGLAADPYAGSARWEARYGSEEISQFRGAELIAQRWRISREDMELFSLESHRRAVAARHAGLFENEIAPYGEIAHDEGPRADTDAKKMAELSPIVPGGRLTAAVSSQISDGASALLIASESAVKKHGLTPRARIHHMSVRGDDPIVMLTAPIAATRSALARAGLTMDQIDLIEINEAFASVVLAWQKELNVDPAKVNVNGGAIALGHPLGASGGRLMATLLNALEHTGGRYGLQTMCEGGGQANVTILERL